MTGKIKKRENPFSQVSNHLIRNENISLKAKGLYALIESYLNIPNFTLYKDMLISICKEGSSSFNAAWNELKEAGYLIQTKIKDETGRFVYEYELLEQPETTPRKSTCGKSTPGNSIDGKPDSINIKSKQRNKQEYILNDDDYAAVLNNYLSKVEEWSSEYAIFSDETRKEIENVNILIKSLIDTSSASLLKTIDNLTQEQALTLYRKALDILYPVDDTRIFNPEGYLVGFIKNQFRK